MKKILVLAVFFGTIANAVIIRNESGTDYKITGKQPATFPLRSSLGQQVPSQIDIPLKNKESFIAEGGGKKYLFNLGKDNSEDEVSSITLKLDDTGKLFGDVFGKQGKDDFDIKPKTIQ